MTERLTEDPSSQLSSPEREFARRWCPMIDRVGGAGGQARAAKNLNWTTSTVSRDYKGDTLPTDDRLLQLCGVLRLPDREVLDLAALLRRARAARRDRLRTSRSESPAPDLPPSPDPAAPAEFEPARRTWFRGRRGLAALLSVVVVLAVVAVVLAVLLPGPGASSAKSAAQPVAKGTFSGLTLEPVRIPVRSLTPALAAEFRQGRTAHATTVTGFEFRNRGAAGLCLTAVNTGATAGKKHDPVVVDTCARAPNQIWIPLQWEVKGFRSTHLVNDQYQSMCLNADKRGGGMHVGSIVQLWDCYPAGNEIWDFGDWHTAVSTGGRSYPLFTTSGRLCLDADKFDLRDGTTVRLWTQYATASQFWS